MSTITSIQAVTFYIACMGMYIRSVSTSTSCVYKRTYMSTSASTQVNILHMQALSLYTFTTKSKASMDIYVHLYLQPMHVHTCPSSMQALSLVHGVMIRHLACTQVNILCAHRQPLSMHIYTTKSACQPKPHVCLHCLRPLQHVNKALCDVDNDLNVSHFTWPERFQPKSTSCVHRQALHIYNRCVMCVHPQLLSTHLQQSVLCACHQTLMYIHACIVLHVYTCQK